MQAEPTFDAASIRRAYVLVYWAGFRFLTLRKLILTF